MKQIVFVALGMMATILPSDLQAQGTVKIVEVAATSPQSGPGDQNNTEKVTKELDQILQSKQGIETRFGEILQFNLAHRDNMQEIHLGVLGELIAPPPVKSFTSPAAIWVYRHDDGLLLVAAEDYPELGLARLEKFAEVDKYGGIKAMFDKKSAPAGHFSLPTHWPSSEKGDSLRFLSRGDIVYKSSDEQKYETRTPPQESKGWVMLGLRGHIFVPLDGTDRPENVLWIMPSSDGGFSLVHSGPALSGIFITVNSSSEITFGDSPVFVVPKERESYEWMFSSNGVPVMIPAGHSAKAYSDGSLRFFVNDGGAVTMEITRQF